MAPDISEAQGKSCPDLADDADRPRCDIAMPRRSMSAYDCQKINEDFWDDAMRPQSERKSAHRRRIRYAFSRPTIHASSQNLDRTALLRADKSAAAKEAWAKVRLRLRTMLPSTWQRPGTEVVLHVYNVSELKAVRRINHVFRVLGTGVYHAAVEVYGKEWSYGATAADITGVFWCDPTQCEAHTYREPVHMGRTTYSQEEVREILEDLCDEWRGTEYDLLRKNCCNFSDEFCQRLGVGSIPGWVMSLASTGAKIEDTVAPTVERYQITVEKGKEARGAWLQASTHFGDFTRGLVATGKEMRVGNAGGSSSSQPSKREQLCAPCDCMRGLATMCAGH